MAQSPRTSDTSARRLRVDVFANTRCGALDVGEVEVHDDVVRVVDRLGHPRGQHAAAFLSFLQTSVWSTPDHSPALAGAITTRLLEPAT